MNRKQNNSLSRRAGRRTSEKACARRLGGAVLAGLLSLAGVVAQAKIEAVFNTPGFGGAATETIETKLIEMIRNAEVGSSIRIAMYTFNNKEVAIELVRAGARGVDVQVVLDGKNKDLLESPRSAPSILVNGITQGDQKVPPLQCSAKRCVTFCTDGLGSSCLGAHINHNKLYLFSRLSDGRSDVVAQSSANLSEAQKFNYNDLLIIDGDKALFSKFTRYWKKLKQDDMKLGGVDSVKGDGPIRAHFSPVFFFGSDPIREVLDKVDCRLAGSRIRVAHSRFKDSRVATAERLRQLSSQGCDVKVIVRDEPGKNSPGSSVVKALRGLDLTILPYENDEAVKNSIHTKLILIDASLNGSKTRVPIVLTGSHNLNGNSLRYNDEVLLDVRGRAIFNQYLKFWNRIKSDAEAAGL